MRGLWLKEGKGCGAGEKIWGWERKVTLAGVGGRTMTLGLTVMPSFTKRHLRHLGIRFGSGLLDLLGVGEELLGWGGAPGTLG